MIIVVESKVGHFNKCSLLAIACFSFVDRASAHVVNGRLQLKFPQATRLFNAESNFTIPAPSSKFIIEQCWHIDSCTKGN